MPSTNGSSAAPPGFTPTPSQSPSSDKKTLSDYRFPTPAPHGKPTIGKYVILEEVLAGGMGVVYKAHDTELGRTVALKMIKTGLLASSEESARFRREAQAAARLDHPNIIPLYEIGQEHGALYFTMPFAWGGSLARHKPRFIADPRAAVALVEKVARAVHYAHQRGILHRDLKPGNILLDENGEPWVSDFGLAKFLDASQELTHVGQVLGTPAYMAPEQASGQTDQLSPQTDVWSLGVILHELLTGQRPAKEKGRVEIRPQDRPTESLQPRAAKRSLSRALETVIETCLKKDPRERYASAEDLADDLARWLRGEPVLVRPLPWPVRLWRTAHRYRRLAGLLLLTVVFVVLLAFAWRGFSPSVPLPEQEDPAKQQILKEKLARINNGEKETLLPEFGEPAWWRWQPRKAQAMTTLDMNQVFRVHAEKQPALLELLPSAPKRYRLSARVQHCKSSSPLGQVGIYFAHGTRRTQEGVTHCFFKLAFNDRVAIPKPPGNDTPADSANKVRLTLPIYREMAGAGFFHQLDTTCALSQPIIPAGAVEPMPWRRLKVEVTPEWIRAYWEEEPITSFGKDGCDPKTPLEWASTLIGNTVVHPKDRSPEPLVPDAELGLGGGLGLYVEKGIAAFQSVVIEPLTPP